MIKIDGSHGEGGGQIIRTALAFSSALGKPFEADKIRQGRSQPGLKAQHLACLNALEQLCGAKFSEVKTGSESLRFVPGDKIARKVEVDIGTAGSITLLLQSLLAPCFFAEHPVTLRIKGGTSGKWQMPFDYFNNVFAPQLRKYADIEAKLMKRGYYPKGGGAVEVKISPKYFLGNRKEAPRIELVKRGSLLQINGVSHASKDLQDRNVAERQAAAASSALSKLGCAVEIRAEYCNTLSTGSGITLWAVFGMQGESNQVNPARLGSDIIGEKGKSAEDVGIDAANSLIKEIDSGAAVDSHLADNLIPFLALFGGRIKTSSITEHTKSNIYAAEQFLGKTFEIKENIIESA